MNISKEDLTWAVAAKLLDAEQAEALWQAWVERHRDRPQFTAANVAYYFGALLILAGMALFLTLAWEAVGGWGIFGLGGIYALIFALAGRHLWFDRQLKIPGGLLVTVAVCMTPLMLYGLQKGLGVWPDDSTYQSYHRTVKAAWLYMELGTLLAGGLALYWVRFPFLTAPIAYTLWYMSMDLTPLFFGQTEWSWLARLWVSFWFGLAMLIVAFLVDRRIRRSQGDFAFWLYLFGLLSFWLGMTLMDKGDEWQRFTYFLINLGLVVLSVLLRRRVFALFGGIGCLGYLSYLTYQVFQESLLFPIAVSLVGVGIIAASVQYAAHRAAWERFAREKLPPAIRDFLPTDE
ncbi:MAG: DUF2157 domain-containing protein [Pseudanabaenaceae cyanobacterium]